jgi:serine/threonine protein kinase
MCSRQASKNEAGPTFADRYSLLDLLGQGGFGIVNVAVDNLTGERVAVKSIRKDRMHGAGYKERLLIQRKVEQIEQEIRIIRLFNHPNIISFIDLVEDADYFRICMELCEGGNILDSIIKSRVPFTENDAHAMITNILGALRHCHSHGIVHRDIKPENIMLRRSDSLSDIKLIDFGLAIEENQIMGSRCSCGTVGYMAPEMYTNSKYNRAVDMWALGVFIFNLYFGTYPISPESRSALENGSFQFPCNFVVSDETRDFIAKLMCKDIMKRMTVETAFVHEWVRLQLLFTCIIYSSYERSNVSAETASRGSRSSIRG